MKTHLPLHVVQVAKGRQPPSLSSNESERDESNPPMPPPMPQPSSRYTSDPADCEFLVQHTTYLDNNRFGCTAETFKLGHLTFPQYWQSSIDLVTEAAGAEVEISLVSSIATITSSRQKPLTPDVKTQNSHALGQCRKNHRKATYGEKRLFDCRMEC
jgi:hypothetical protein